ncbi:MAG: hypothetical protein KGI55_09065, partial [Gammaproteobacteria bacterium]|nr:hypothetical protein [Gammaproteobacteria bacterium]
MATNTMAKEKRMRTGIASLMLCTASLGLALIASAGRAPAAEVDVALTAQRATATMTDGAKVPMWGYCVSSATPASAAVGAACAAAAAWTPGPTLYAAPGDTLVVTLSNQLPVATSFVILGQFGGGLGAPVRDPQGPIVHPAVTTTTWPVKTGGSFTPPTQGTRVRSFVPEAAAMGTTPGSQIYTYAGLKPGTYLYETGTHPSLQAPMGLYGVLVVTTSPAVTVAAGATPASIATPGTAYPAGAINGVSVPAVNYDADAIFLISEVDAAQNAAVDAAAVAGTNDRTAWNAPGCTTVGGTTPCYPPAVNYAPTYILLNGQSFDRNNPSGNAAEVPPLYATGNLMVRIVNAGLRTHVPSIVGLPMSLIADDGNRAPGAPKVQSEALMTAGKTRDVLVTPAPAATTAASPAAYAEAAYAFFDRSLGLSTNGAPFGG